MNGFQIDHSVRVLSYLKVGMVLFFSLIIFLLNGCYMKVTVKDLNPSSDQSSTGPSILNNSTSDFINGETVTTANNFQVYGAFGEISEKQSAVLTPGWQVEGSFYPIQE